LQKVQWQTPLNVGSPSTSITHEPHLHVAVRIIGTLWVGVANSDIPQATLNPDAVRYIDNLLAQPG